MTNSSLFRRTLLLVVPVGVITLLVNFTWLGDLEPIAGRPYELPLWAIVIGFIVAEVLAVDIESR